MRLRTPEPYVLIRSNAVIAAVLPILLAAPASPASPLHRDAGATPTQHGKASFYHARFNGRRMANGERFDPNEAIAAHRTLPFGTVVLVTNLGNGLSAVVRVTDRGPFNRGRIIDLAPRIAARLAMVEEGVVAVSVTPIAAVEPQAPGVAVSGLAE